MKFLRLVFVVLPWLLGCLALAGPGYAAVSVTDNSGRNVTLQQPARRILALAPHITENLFSIGAGDRIVGAVAFSDYPPQAREIERVGSFGQLNLEQVLALQPDLVIAWPGGSPPAQLERLRQLGMPVFESDPHSFAMIASNLRLYGQLTGLQAGADAAAFALEQRVERLRERHAAAIPLRVFYQLWHEPLMTVNRSLLVDQMLRLCGGENPFADRPESVPQLGVESVLAVRPEVILTTTEEAPRDWIERWQRWPELPAVQHNLFYQLNADWMHRATLRALLGAEQLCAHLDDARVKLGRINPSDSGD
ncbi:cobalamin-binding protein [Marinobacterium rhizophilum]|uniref:Cobalamin-binding protein n=1 Tax=Marinobacterium rhizophilum TaxID=420402 RepID=A0ABY5HS08_9GAMM|nr:cobalamin-binding protein [Marinobacterium rhizophilum]UTW13984.1 cobalamin-binding protein [Marinobacterium rhizophilum]